MVDISEAILRIHPKAEFTVVGETYEGINWISSDIPLPSKEEVDTSMRVLEEEYNLTEYERSRESKYPKREDLVVALWELVIEGDSLSADELQAKRLEIKEKYPKPF